MTIIINFWLSIWLYVIGGIGVYLALQLYRNRKTWDKLTIFGTLGIIVLVLHVMEEWVLPGGLHYLYNVAGQSSALSRYPMSRLTDMITNFAGVLLGFIVVKTGGFKKPAAIVIMLASGFEVIVHIGIGISSMNVFGAYGQNTLYSPGLITSLFGFLPVAVLLARHLIHEAKPTAKQWLIGVVATFAVFFLCVNLPEMLIAKEDNPYAFTNRGYYEQFAEQYETDHQISY